MVKMLQFSRRLGGKSSISGRKLHGEIAVQRGEGDAIIFVVASWLLAALVGKRCSRTFFQHPSALWVR